MSLMILSVTANSRSRRLPRWKQLLAELRQRARSRYELMALDDRQLSDVGLTRTEASHEASKPFWQG
jgi:uncharacterized protein YjiS (DUF1127 family)